MNKPLRVLIVEDSEDDVLLTIHALKKGGYEPTYERVEDAGSMRKVLETESWEVILCDYNMPKFDGLAAIAVLKETGIDIPLIIISGAIGEEEAAECMRLGARDFFMKGKLPRLASAVERELKEAESRRQRKQAEKELQESEERLRDIIFSIADWVWEVDENGVYTYSSQQSFDLLGESRGDIIGKTPFDFMPPDETKRVAAIFSEIAANKAPIKDLENWNIGKNGKRICLLTNGVPMLDGKGNLKGYRGVDKDITDRKQAETELKESKALFEAVVENVPLMIFLKESTDLRFVIFNRAGEELLGYDRKDLMGKNNLDLFPPEQAAHFMAKDREVLDGEGGILDIPEEPILTAKKGQRLLHTRKVCVRGADGEKKYLLGISEDITERKQAEENLKNESSMRAALLDNIPGCIALILRKGTHEIVASNKVAREVGAVPGQTCFKTCAMRDDNCPFCLAPTMWNTDQLQRLEVEYREKWYEGIWAPLSEDLYVHYIYDITERKETEKNLRNTLESLSRAVNTTIQVMVSAVEVRDPYTAGHQIKSANLASAIATEMGLPREKIEGIHIAGSIHDIGKLSIPAEILSKPTKLSEIEFSLIKAHAQRGFEMLKDVESPWPLAEIVYQHHERMDGSGYPRNLKGKEICMEARILSVADVVEAMASHRPYRPSLGIDAALNEIEKNRGLFYDTTVADVCLKLFREKGFKLQ
jgi:PAS domain S-box-containing protein